MAFIENILKQILDAMHDFTGSYGWAIILLAAAIKIVLYIPTHQQFKAMKDMQAIQPEMKKVQEMYKDNPKKQQAELMGLYKKHKINPLGGCLPLIIQMPILWAIWKTIMTYEKTFKTAYFLWINPSTAAIFPKIKMFGKVYGIAANLSQPDLLMLILYGLSMYLSQKLTVTDPATAKNQAMLNLMMPVMFTFILISFPSALILYWLAFNILSIIQQIIVMKQPSKVLASIEAEKSNLSKGGKQK